MSTVDEYYYLYDNGHYVKYSPVNDIGTISIRLEKTQKHFEYFDNLFKNSIASVHLDYLVIVGGCCLEENVEMYSKYDEVTYISGGFNLQTSNFWDNSQFVVYQFHTHELEKVSQVVKIF